MKSELERYKAALSALDEFLDDIREHAKHGDITHNASILQQAIRQMKSDVESFAHHIKCCVNPKPEMETVEVSSWVTVSANGKVMDSGIDEDEARGIEASSNGKRFAAQLTGTCQRPKPRPVERTWTLNDAALVADANEQGNITWVRIAPYPTDAPLGKTGTMTFTWQE